MLTDDRHLPNWSKGLCPYCLKGKVKSLKLYKKRGWCYRCRAKNCQYFIQPHALHPVFSNHKTASTLQEQASVSFALTCGVSQATTHKLLKKDHKLIEQIEAKTDTMRQQYVELTEKTTEFGGREEWMDAEADEVDIAKGLDPDKEDPKRPVVWEQWGGVVMRGFSKTLVLSRLNPSKTRKRAPGPGPTRKRDWTTFAKRRLAGRKIILHSDGAQTYKLRVKGLLHDIAVHKKKRVIVKGKFRWIKPKYSKIVSHRLPEGGKIHVKSGTQIIDRFWSHLRTHLKHRKKQPGSSTLRRRIRSAQFTYWFRGEDLWTQTGNAFEFLRGQ